MSRGEVGFIKRQNVGFFLFDTPRKMSKDDRIIKQDRSLSYCFYLLWLFKEILIIFGIDRRQTAGKEVKAHLGPVDRRAGEQNRFGPFLVKLTV